MPMRREQAQPCAAQGVHVGPCVLHPEGLTLAAAGSMGILWYPIMENQMEKKMENEMEAGII